MTFVKHSGTGPSLVVHSPCGGGTSATYRPGDTIYGLRESERCIFEIDGVDNARIFVDDVEIRQGDDGRYEWTAAFFAGRVQIVVTSSAASEATYFAFVGPSTEKIADEQFDAMVREIQKFRASLLLGSSSAAMEFGDNAGSNALETLIRLARLRLYAPEFLREIRKICRAPHRSLLQAERRVSLARVKRLHPLALREPLIAAAVAGRTTESMSLDLLHVGTSTATPTFDTPSNRALKALLTRLAAQVSALLGAVAQGRLGGDPEEQKSRRPRREHFLRNLLTEAKALQTREPFCSVSRLETSAASLTQISAQPIYSSAFRYGTRALVRGVEGARSRDHLHVSPTWGVYETWCFVHILSKLAERVNHFDWRAIGHGVVSAAESYELELSSGIRIEAHFQANFTAGGPHSNRVGWSLSRFRIPDIVIVVRSASRLDFLVLDAKFRSKRDNVLEAMESAHIYHDSLRVRQQKPNFCALLLPAMADVPHLEADSFLLEHGVGTICHFSPGGPGVERCVDLIANWAVENGL
ncbi:DUF2357 domain-containing protein [Burkholderia ambifaria]|jgi:hypothetical protein|uniref:DUF2357 domain-containing protein n=1 Tax=Burkholderia ambifaria TaxID=152480 RepID=UPI00158D38BB|nr:DUF2357 domain-containing protein [Burkholderia ambifaria]